MPTPTGAEPRLEAARAAAAVLDQGRALDEALAGPLQKLAAARDRAQVRRLANALMRDWPAADRLIRALLRRRPARRDRLVHFILAIALVELREAREPDRAVVHAAVESTGLAGLGHLRGLVNGVLRSYQRQRAELDAAGLDDPVRHYGYPAWLIERVQADWPADWRRILEAGNQSPPLWLRVNRRFWSRAEARRVLAGAGVESSAVAGREDALILRQRAAISKLPGFSEGGLSVQDGAAQTVVDYLQLEPGLRVLDACAAPGGKTAHALERADLDLTAVDVDSQRLDQVAATLTRLGLKARLVRGDASEPQGWWDGRPFDRILVDAPCSATGVIRRHPDIRWLRRSDDVAALTRLQGRLLAALWPLLKPGGILVYATCSILKVENERPIHSFLEQHTDARALQHDTMPGCSQTVGRQILPGAGDMDGFYHVAVERLHR